MRPKKLFTPLEATRTLPLVRGIVTDINELGRELRRLAVHETRGDESAGFRRLLCQMEGLMQELENLGCFYKDWDFSVGLVDFPSLIGGEMALLCWRSDEAEIQFYHSYESGYPGRKPIPSIYLLETRELLSR